MRALWLVFLVGVSAMLGYLYLATLEPTPWIALLVLIALASGCLSYLLHVSGVGRTRDPR